VNGDKLKFVEYLYLFSHTKHSLLPRFERKEERDYARYVNTRRHFAAKNMYTNDVIKKNYSSISILPKRNVFYFFLFLPSGLSFPGCACIDTRARFKKALNLSLSCIIKELIYCIYLEKIQNIRAMRREFSRSRSPWPRWSRRSREPGPRCAQSSWRSDLLGSPRLGRCSPTTRTWTICSASIP